MPGPVPTDVPAYRRLRWQARLSTLGFAIIAAGPVAAMVALAGQEDPRMAIVPYLMLCALGAFGFWVLRSLWRRSYAARPVILSADAGPGAVIGVPELDADPRPHIGLTGDAEPPRRW